MNQLDLFSKTITERFNAFHAENPRVYKLFELFAIQLIHSGRKRIGARMIIERIRWECYTGSKDEAGFKINNMFIAHYSRLFAKNHPEYKDCFEMKILKVA